MGFLLYAARKLQLKSQINQLNYRAMTLSQEQQTITKQIADFQQGMNNTKNNINLTTQALYAGKAASFGLVTNAQGVDYLATDDATRTQAQQNIANLNTYGTNLSIAANVTNSVFDAVNKAQLAQLQAKDSEISLEKEAVESQTLLLQEEYKSVKQAEQDAAKDSAPTFGLA